MKKNTLFTCFFKIQSRQNTVINPHYNNNENTMQKKLKKQVKIIVNSVQVNSKSTINCENETKSLYLR